MAETQEAGDQDQKQPGAVGMQSPHNAAEQVDSGNRVHNGTQSPVQPEEQVGIAQNGAGQPPEQAVVGAEAQDTPPGEKRDEDESDEESHQVEQEGSEQAEGVHQKKRRDDPQRQLNKESNQRKEWAKKREDEHIVEFGNIDISLQLLGDQDAHRDDKFFVAPDDYQRFLDEIAGDTGMHILIVAGKESSGKFMTAFYLARHAWKNEGLKCYRFTAHGNRTLLDIWADEKLPDNSVILFDEVFDKGQIDLEDLTNRYVHLNERLADKTDVWFIFTVLEGPVLEKLQATVRFPILSTAHVNRRQVLEKLIDEFILPSRREEARARLLSFEGELPSPARLSQLFEAESDPEDILRRFTQRADQLQEAPSVWFSLLTPMNYQLYALLAVLFDKLDMPMLEGIYTMAVYALRRQGMDGPDEFIDPRRIGTHQMHTRLGIGVRYNKLEFHNQRYQQYVAAQVENYQGLLWSLIDPDDPSTFEGLVGLLRRLSEIDVQLVSRREENEQAVADSSRQMRYAIAVMIARVGVHHQIKLDILLDKLLQHESAFVSLTATQVLEEIARKGGYFDFIERILRTWMHSGRLDQMWIAAPSIAYIYNAIAGILEEEPVPQEVDEGDAVDMEDLKEEENGVKDVGERKKRSKGYLARMRDILSELVEVHNAFSEESVNEARNILLQSYRVSLRHYYEESSEPVTGEDGLLFRELVEGDKERFLQSVYMEIRSNIDEAVERDLKMLKNSWLNQMRMALVQTLEHIAQKRPRDVTRLVRIWLDRKDREDPLWEIGHMGLNYLFRESADIKEPSLLEQAAYPLLDLMPLAMRAHTLTLESLQQIVNLVQHIEDLEKSMTLDLHLEVGRLMGGDSLLYALWALQQWYENLGQTSRRQEKKGAVPTEDEDEEDDEEDEKKLDGHGENVWHQNWQEKVSMVLTNAMNSAPQEERQRLRNMLSLWVKTGDRRLSRIAHILISHAYVMDGIVLDLPGSQRAGVVVIDSQRREQGDRDRVFDLLQRLAAIVPIHLYWLGYTKSRRLLQSDHGDEKGQMEESVASFGPDDLLLRSANRPSLLMPILQSGQGQRYVAGQTYFVVVFHTEEILDLAELYPGLAAQEQPEENIFLQHLQRKEVAAQASDQVWQGKVYLQPTQAKPTTQVKPIVPDSLVPLLTVVRPTSIAMLEGALRKRIAITLRTRPASELWQELRACIGGPVPQSLTVDGLTGEIKHWLAQLADTKALYPDVSLFILWTVLVHSLENLSEARELVEFLLQEPGETSAEQQSRREVKEAKRAWKLRLQMGIACTRMLFYLYGVENPALPVEPYGKLLHLLPRMVVSASSVSDILPVLAILFELVRSDSWLRVVNDDEGAFFESVQKVPLKELDMLREWVKNYQYLLGLSRFFLELNQPFPDFVAFGEEVYRRYGETRSGRPGWRNSPPGEMASKILAFLPTENEAEEQDRYTWALQQLEFQQASLRQPDSGERVLAGLRNQEILLNHFSDEIQLRQDGIIERLKEGDFYGIVLVEAGSKAATRQAFQFVLEFVEQRRQNKAQHVTLMLQRLGERGILAKIRTNRKIKNEREISDKRQLPQVMGPLLERYPADQVAFVLLITVSPVLDYDDWGEQEQWTRRLWLASLGNWYPYYGEMIDLGERTTLTLETILKTSEEERATL